MSVDSLKSMLMIVLKLPLKFDYGLNDIFLDSHVLNTG